MDGLVRIALRTVRQQATLLVQTHDRPPINRFSPRGLQEFIHQIRTRAIRDLRETVATHFPDHQVLTDSTEPPVRTGHCWFFEPLSGAENFLRSLPEYSAVIGIFEDGALQHSVVYQYLEDAEFSATKDEGAMVNQSRLRVSGTSAMNQAVIAYERHSTTNDSLRIADEVHHLGANVRTSGCIALDLARVAQGKLDACIHVGDDHFVPVATDLLVTEAGGFTTPPSKDCTTYIAGNPPIFKTITSKLLPKTSDLLLSLSK